MYGEEERNCIENRKENIRVTTIPLSQRNLIFS